MAWRNPETGALRRQAMVVGGLRNGFLAALAHHGSVVDVDDAPASMLLAGALAGIEVQFTAFRADWLHNASRLAVGFAGAWDGIVVADLAEGDARYVPVLESIAAQDPGVPVLVMGSVATEAWCRDCGLRPSRRFSPVNGSANLVVQALVQAIADRSAPPGVAGQQAP